jgi:hypothetical protein
MKRTEAFLPAFALVALLIGSVGTASAATPGYAAYSVQYSFMGVSHSITVNESVSATSNAKYDNLALTVDTGNSTFSYSRSINSSLQISPFLPAITNQSFSYASGSSTVSLSVKQNGSAPLQFHGKTYSLTSYAVAAAYKANGTTGSLSAAILAFPSGLVYSVKVSAPIPSLPVLQGLGAAGIAIPGLGGNESSLSTLIPQLPTLAPTGTVTLAFTLLSTSLPLAAATASPVEQAASIGIGAGAVVSVLALALGVRYRHRHQAEAQTKPEYSVD